MIKFSKLEKIANKFCDSKVGEYPNIWWCYGSDDEHRIHFYTKKWSESENDKPKWTMDSDGNIKAI